ncbi:MAG: hypothetical protein M1825_002066 [Sarcosagium campestre]|nr:MAG: hypothetical protein M1825_002066 [Sarcosagium campestre]
MDQQRTSAALLDRTNNDVVQLLKRFENIIALAPSGGRSRNATAVEAYQMEVETAALVRAAEDLLSLTRSMKEAWLFGRLQTVADRKEAAEGDNKDVQAVVDGLGKVLRERTGTA